jgi:hypothetical protein
METGPWRILALLLHMVAAGVYDTRHIREQPGNILDGYPFTGIIRMVIVVIQYRRRYFFKVIDAAVVVLKPDKGMVIAEQLLQFLRCTAGTNAGIPAVLCIAALPRVVDCYLHGFGIVFHFSHLLLWKMKLD